MATWYAHSKDVDNESTWQSLPDHLNNVARMASEFANYFDCGSLGYACGELHDAGKSTPSFMERLHGSQKPVDHTTAGAYIAREKYGELGNLLAYILIGHHGGMPNATEEGKRRSMLKRLSTPIESYEAFFSLVDSGEIELPELAALMDNFNRKRSYGASKSESRCMAYSVFLLSKMLFSCLVDADYLDTESFCDPQQALIREKKRPELEQLLSMLEQHMRKFEEGDDAEALINQARNSISKDCQKSAANDPGIFTLTVPTGGGKTLASLIFALTHALRNGQWRIIYVVPFTTIIEQTASVFKRIFGDDAVLEHHSNFDEDRLDDEEKIRHRLVTQNWDAPIVVTTSVQFFESIYANKPSKCRKLHNIANSVVILDEAQTLPDELLDASLAALEDLALGYKTSIVLCTATQPALSSRWPFGSAPLEIIRSREMFAAAFGQRIHFELLGEQDEEGLAAQVASEPQVLCVVGTRKKARALFELVKSNTQEQNKEQEQEPVAATFEYQSGVYHLSASMIPAHRSTVLDEIRERLRSNRPCKVVSTQLIEAGVDIDFPVVYREMAGLDSIIQAGGRCNREGKREAGTVYIFDYCINEKTRRSNTWLERMKQIGRNTLRECGALDETAIKAFFETRYRTQNTDERCLYNELSDTSMITSGFMQYEYERYANDFRLIDDSGVSVFIPWGKEGEKLLACLETAEFPASMTSKLQRYIVNVPAERIEEYRRSEFIYEIEPFYVLNIGDAFRTFYRNDVGLLLPGEEEMRLLIN